MAQSLDAPGSVQLEEADSAISLVLAGLYVRAQRLLKALAFIDEMELEDCGDSILRSLFDLTSTFIWLSDEAEGDERFSRLVRSHHRDFRLLAGTGIDVFTRLLSQANQLVEIVEDTTEVGTRIPSIEQRLEGHPLQAHYFRYRDLSRRSHASVTAAVMYFEQTDSSNVLRVSHERERRFASHFLAYGVMLVFFMAMDVSKRGLVEPPGDLEAIGTRLWTYWRMVEGKDA